jgi:regulator of cell morphogenesis and NO signaling
MKANMPGTVFTVEKAPLFNINEAVDRLKEEHNVLQVTLQQIYALTCTVRTEMNEQRLHRYIGILKHTVLEFKKQLDAHSKWEEKELFPMAAWYFGNEQDAYELMEQDHEVAERSIHDFIEEIDRAAVPIQHEEASRMASYLFQAYVVLTNHFREEEELLSAFEDHSNTIGY